MHPESEKFYDTLEGFTENVIEQIQESIRDLSDTYKGGKVRPEKKRTNDALREGHGHEVGMYAGKLHDLEAIAAKERQGRRTDLEGENDIPQNSAVSDTREIVANTLGVGSRMLDEFKLVLKHAPALECMHQGGSTKQPKIL